MSTLVSTADNRLRSRLDTVATGSTWGTETMNYLSQAQIQVVIDLPSEMFSDGALAGESSTQMGYTPSTKVYECSRGGDSLRVLWVTHNDGTTIRGAQKLDSPEKVYNRGAICNYASPAQGGAFYALALNKMVVFPACLNDIIIERYIKIPTAFTASTNSYQIPDWLVDVSISYAVYLALSQVGKGAEAAAALTAYNNEIASLYKTWKLEVPPKFISTPKTA